MAQAPVRAQFRTAPRSLITEKIDRSRLAAIPGAVHVEIARAQDLGAVDANEPMEHIQLAMQRTPERQAALDALVEAQQRKGDPSYHQWLTPETMGAEFGPSSADLETVKGFLQAEGFKLNGVMKSGMIVDVSGTAAQVQHTFHTEVHHYRMPNGEVRYSASQAAQLPVALVPAVSGLVSLSNIPPHAMHQEAVKPLYYDSNSKQALGAQDFYAIYGETSLLSTVTGSGVTIALLEETDINTADVTSFRTQFAVSPATPVSLTVSHGSGSISCTDPGTTAEEGEAALDTEWSGAVAPGAALLFMSCATASTSGIILSAEAVIDNNLASVMSLSYGSSELNNSSYGSMINSLWEQAAAQGQTVAVSAGDNASDVYDDGSVGSHGLNVNVLASSPYDIAAGGTDFQDTYNQDIDSGTSYGPSHYWSTTNGTGDLTAKGYVAETTWNASCASSLLNAVKEGTSAAALAFCEDSSKNTNYLDPVGGGGGVSILHTRPSWQTGTVYGLPTTASAAGRVMPDISLYASNGTWSHSLFVYRADHSPVLYGDGGTSFVAPQIAGIMALINQSTGGRVGLAGPELYSLAGTAYGTTTYAGGSCNGSGATGAGETASTPASNCVFYDIETGNNAAPCTAGTTNCYSDSGKTYGMLSTSTTTLNAAYPATQGWDYATGIGSVNIGNLVSAWVDSTVTAQAATLTIVSQPSPFVYGSYILPLIQVSGTNTISPTGTVTYSYNSGASYGNFTLADQGCVSGTCTSTASSGYVLPGADSAGTHFTVSSTYTSNSLYYSSGATATATITVMKQTPTVTPAAVSINYGTATATFSATIAYTGVSGTLAPTGGLTFSVDSGTAVTASCSGSSSPLTCTYTYNTSTLSSGTHTLTAAIPGNSNYNATSATATITVAPVFASLSVMGYASPAVMTEGGTVTVTALDENGAVYTGFTGTVTLTSSDSKATLPAAYTFVAGDAGVHVFSVTLNSAGSESITATSGGVSASQTGIAVDDAIWILNGVGTLAKLNGGGAAVTTGVGTSGLAAVKGGAAFDASGNVWSVRTAVSSLSFASKTGAGAATYTGGGIASPSAVAVDGAGMIWVANTPGTCSSSCAAATLSEFSSAGAAMSIAGGYAAYDGMNTPSAIAVDRTGGLWVADKKANTVVHVFGVAAPVVTPLSTATVNGVLGAKP